MILASTNYFPGLIHQYCASLIKSMQEKDYADYTVDKTPPYELTETQYQAVLKVLQDQHPLVHRYWHDATVQMSDFKKEFQQRY